MYIHVTYSFINNIISILFNAKIFKQVLSLTLGLREREGGRERNLTKPEWCV